MKERVRVDIYRHFVGVLKASRGQWVESNIKIMHGTSSSQVAHDLSSGGALPNPWVINPPLGRPELAICSDRRGQARHGAFHAGQD